MAKPEALADGSVNLMVWQCTIPGKAGVSFFYYGDYVVFFFGFEMLWSIWSGLIIFISQSLIARIIDTWKMCLGLGSKARRIGGSIG